MAGMSIFRILGGVVLVGASVGLIGCGPQAQETETAPAIDAAAIEAYLADLAFETTESQASYGFGYKVGQSLADRGSIGLDTDALMAGLFDALGGAESRVDADSLRKAFAELEQRAREEQSKELNAWLTQNAEKEGVVTTASGLQYEVIESGDGPSPQPSDTVEVHYHGTLVDGTVFDSSVERGQTIKFPVTGVIQGWVEALQLMQVGDKWRLFIPPSLGYGSRATGKIPPNSILIFEVELIGIE